MSKNRMKEEEEVFQKVNDLRDEVQLILDVSLLEEELVEVSNKRP